jgi:hypothetical protein
MIPESLQTFRELNDGHPTMYPVRVWFSRPLNDYERVALPKLWAGVRFTDDAMVVILLDTTLERFRDELDELNGRLAIAETHARRTREAAEAEDRRLTQLAADITAA